MSQSSAVHKPYPAKDFLAARSLDRADRTVLEVFQMMFGMEIHPADSGPSSLPLSELDEKTAIVGFSGFMRGSCQVRIGALAARDIASAMLGGVPFDEADDSINDALGELCNMLAGGWKNAMPALSSECVISPPSVISGRNYKVHVRKHSMQLTRTYCFGAHLLHLTLNCEDPETSSECDPNSSEPQ
jgi:chemotaxis protein CheX